MFESEPILQAIITNNGIYMSNLSIVDLEWRKRYTDIETWLLLKQ